MDRLIAKDNCILLPIEIKNRELDGKLLLALHLISEDYNVIIGDRNGVNRLIQNVHNPIFISKSLAIILEKTFKKVREQNGKVVVLLEEGANVGSEKYKKDEIKSFYPEQALHYVDFIFTYGDNYKKLLSKELKIFADDQIFVSGNTRFDLHKKRFKKYYYKRINIIQKKYGKYILINTKFSFANYYLGADYIVDVLKNDDDFTPLMIDVMMRKIHSGKSHIREYINMARRVCGSFPGYSVILRPHPGEKLTIYRQELRGIKNLYITNDDCAAPWIFGAELIIHPDCTTGIETLFTGEKPVLSYRPWNDREANFELAAYISEEAKDEDDLINKINKYLIQKNTWKLSEEKRKYLRERIINIEKDTGPLICNKMKQIYENNYNSISHNCASYNNKKANRLPLLRYYIKPYLGWWRSKYIYKTGYTQKFPSLTKREVIRGLGAMMKIENMNFKFEVKKYGVNTYLIRKKGT